MSGTLHATAVAIGGRGVLLTGRPGAGKSDLALRLIDRGGVLVSDDRVIATAEGGRLWLSPPLTIAGLIEVRGIGLVRMPFLDHVPACLLIDLGMEPERLPDPVTRDVNGVALPLLALRPFDASAAIRVELAVALAARNGLAMGHD